MGMEVKEDVAVLAVVAKGVTTAKANKHHLLKDMGSQPFFGQMAHPHHGAIMN